MMINQKTFKLSISRLFAFLFLLIISLSFLRAASHNFTRPEKVQQAVDTAFTENLSHGKDAWMYNGSYGGYKLLGIEERDLMRHLVSLHKKEIYIIDVGCAYGGWGQYIATILVDHYKDTDIKFYIISVTGGNECCEKTEQIGNNIILHQFNQFKIENIDEELIKRGFHLENKVDLIVSHWTLRHLVDPFGTLTRMYQLLTPFGGRLFTNGFIFKDEDLKKFTLFPRGGYASILGQSNAHTLFYGIESGSEAHAFLLERNDEKPLGLPLKYTGNLSLVPFGYDCGSGMTTEFCKNKNVLGEAKIKYFRARSRWGSSYYCIEGDARGERLYTSLD